jgi:hypothetical protein
MNEELSELGYDEFVRARNLYWPQEPKSGRKEAVAAENDGISGGESGNSFMLYAPGPQQIFAVFEDSGESGWFYLYSVQQKKILKCAHIYDRANVAVDEDVVDIGWAADGSACGLAVWGEFRTFLGVSKDLEIRKPIVNGE